MQLEPPAIETVDGVWRAYAKRIWRGVRVPPTRHEETKMAFFAGAHEVYRMLVYGIPPLSTEDAGAAIVGMREELRAFVAESAARAKEDVAKRMTYLHGAKSKT